VQAVTGSSKVVNSAARMAAISLDDVRRSSSLVIALPRVDDCLVPQSTAEEGSGHLLARAVIIPWAEIPARDAPRGDNL
jgi:hypothetical protein